MKQLTLESLHIFHLFVQSHLLGISACLPQIHVIRKEKNKIKYETAHFKKSLYFSSVCSVIC